MPGPTYDSKTTSTGIISFTYNKDPELLKHMLEKSNINIRVGDHCSLDSDFQESFRLSLHAYNIDEDIKILLSNIKN